MVVVRIELWPHRDPTKSRLLGVASISNDGTGTLQNGNYNIELTHAGKYFATKKGCWKKGRVENHRRKLSPYHLVYKALKAALKL